MCRCGILLVLLLLIGCDEAVVETAVPTATTVVTERPLATATSTRKLDSPVSEPVEANTPTPIPLSPVLSEMINNDARLSVKQSFEPSSVSYVSDDEMDKAVLIINTFREDGVEIRDYISNQEILNLPNSPYTVAGHVIFQAAEGNQNDSLTAYDLFTGDVLWERPLPPGEWEKPIPVGDAILFASVNTDPYDGASTIHFISQQTGEFLWENQVTGSCYSTTEAIETEKTIIVSCYEAYFALDKTTGELVYQNQLPEYTYLYNLRAIDNQVFLRRNRHEENEDGYQVEVIYLQAVDAQDLENVVWQKQVDRDVFTFEVFEEDIIYRDGNRVVRLDGRTGDPVWETELITHSPGGLLFVDKWLFVGSRNGYLHLLDGMTGATVWEQDIWATLQPRPLSINPLVWTGKSLISYLDYEVVELGLHGETDWQIEQAESFSTPLPMPTQTPFPILPTLEPYTTLQQPENIEQWPAYVLAYLNSPGATPSALQQVLSDWLKDEPTAELNAATYVQEVDLNNDQLQDLIVYTDNWPGWFLTLIQTSPSQYEPAWVRTNEANRFQLLAVIDLNNDGLTDFVYSEAIYGMTQSTVTIHPVGWQNGELESLSANPISSTNVWVEDIQVEDIDGDGFIDIVFQGGTYGSSAAGPNRPSTFMYSVRDGMYELVSQEPTLPQEYFFFLVEANQLLTAEKYEEAIDLYKNTMATEDAIYYYNTPHQRAFAEFQIMLAYLLLNDEAAAAAYAENGRYQDQLYGEVKQIFWETYQGTRNWTEAAEAARTHVRLAGYQKAQLVEWVGYANTPLTLNDIVPCDVCLQGTIGSDMGP